MALEKAQELESRLRVQGVTDEILASAKDFHPHIEKNLDAILDGLVGHASSIDEMREILADDIKSGQFKKSIGAHWLSVFSGKLDIGYFDRSKEIGSQQSRMGIRPRWLMGNYAFMQDELNKLAVKTYRFRTNKLVKVLSAISSLVWFDMNVRLSSYFVLAEQAVVEKRNESLAGMKQSFEGSLKSEIGAVAVHVQAIEPEAQMMAAAASQTLSQSANVVAASNEISSNIDGISVAVSDLSQSISAIENSVVSSANIAERAVSETKRTDQQIQKLSETAGRIGEVVSLINDIAEQTNLLALNATIEAARAGEAGKGFAVVANEVKSLATQTANATGDITSQVDSIQAATKASVEAIRGISSTVHEISENSNSITQTIREQNSATAQISGNIEVAVNRTREISIDITAMNEVAEQTVLSCEKLTERTQALGETKVALDGAADQFLDEITTS